MALLQGLAAADAAFVSFLAGYTLAAAPILLAVAMAALSGHAHALLP